MKRHKQDAFALIAVNCHDNQEEFLEGHEGAPLALALAYAFVAVEGDHQNFGLGAGGAQQAHVAHVQQIEAAVGKHHLAAATAQVHQLLHEAWVI